MKKILLLLLGIICFAAHQLRSADDPLPAPELPAPAPTPRILDLTGTPHPKAEVQSVDRVGGFLTFAWLNSAGARVDSGGSVVRFTPIPIVPTPTDGSPTHADPDDSVLITAIQSPPAEVTAVPKVVSRRQLLIALYRASGKKEADVLAFIASLPTEGARYEASIEFQAATFERTHPLVGAIGTAFSLSSGQIDDIFRAAILL